MTTDTQPAPLTRRDLEAKLVAAAWTDEEFHARFLADPKAVLEEGLGTKLPDNLVVTAHQEGPDSLHLVIPHKPEIDLDELSDEDLEKVAGGVGIYAVSAAINLGMITLIGLTCVGTAAGAIGFLIKRNR